MMDDRNASSSVRVDDHAEFFAGFTDSGGLDIFPLFKLPTWDVEETIGVTGS